MLEKVDFFTMIFFIFFFFFLGGGEARGRGQE